MGRNTGEFQLELEREVYKYIHHHTRTSSKKAGSQIIRLEIYNIFGLGVLGYSSSGERKTKNTDRVHCYYFTEGRL